MKTLKLWQHPKNQNYYIVGFKISMNRLLSWSGVGARLVLLKGVELTEAVFEGECADAEVNALREQLRKKADQLK